MPNLPPTEGRVPQHSTDSMNTRVRDQSIQNVRALLKATPAQLSERLHELDHEWDMERTLEFNASIACLTGWCPPMPVFRKLGFRTAEEIQDEKNAVLVLKGDYEFIKKQDSREALINDMERNKKRCNSFVGPSAALSKEE